MFSPTPINWNFRKNYAWLKSVEKMYREGLVDKRTYEECKKEHAEYEESRRNISDKEFNKLLMTILESKF
jgi:hypothetical protein